MKPGSVVFSGSPGITGWYPRGKPGSTFCSQPAGSLWCIMSQGSSSQPGLETPLERRGDDGLVLGAYLVLGVIVIGDVIVLDPKVAPFSGMERMKTS